MIGQRNQPWTKDRRYRERLKRKGLCPRCRAKVRHRNDKRARVYCALCRRRALARWTAYQQRPLAAELVLDSQSMAEVG